MSSCLSALAPILWALSLAIVRMNLLQVKAQTSQTLGFSPLACLSDVSLRSDRGGTSLSIPEGAGTFSSAMTSRLDKLNDDPTGMGAY